MRGIALGFRAMRGGSVVVAVAVEAGKPRLLLSRFLATAVEGDRLAREPYHVAVELARDGGDARAAVAEGRRRQDAMAAEGLKTLLGQLPGPVTAALLVNRAGWMTDLLEYSLFAPEHPPVAEGLAVRDALRAAFAACRIESVELDEKSLPARAAETLALPEAAIEAALRGMGADAGKPWRKEQKLACIAAWVTAMSVAPAASVQ